MLRPYLRLAQIKPCSREYMPTIPKKPQSASRCTACLDQRARATLPGQSSTTQLREPHLVPVAWPVRRQAARSKGGRRVNTTVSPDSPRACGPTCWTDGSAGRGISDECRLWPAAHGHTKQHDHVVIADVIIICALASALFTISTNQAMQLGVHSSIP